MLPWALDNRWDGGREANEMLCFDGGDGDGV